MLAIERSVYNRGMIVSKNEHKWPRDITLRVRNFCTKVGQDHLSIVTDAGMRQGMFGFYESSVLVVFKY